MEKHQRYQWSLKKFKIYPFSKNGERKAKTKRWLPTSCDAAESSKRLAGVHLKRNENVHYNTIQASPSRI